jgi:hypothetical protein
MTNDSVGWMGMVGGPWALAALALVAVVLVAVLRGRTLNRKQ